MPSQAKGNAASQDDALIGAHAGETLRAKSLGLEEEIERLPARDEDARARVRLEAAGAILDVHGDIAHIHGMVRVVDDGQLNAVRLPTQIDASQPRIVRRLAREQMNLVDRPTRTTAKHVAV